MPPKDAGNATSMEADIKKCFFISMTRDISDVDDKRCFDADDKIHFLCG